MKTFTDEQLQQIDAAVTQAEARCHTEIVPVFAAQSDGYELATWRAGVVFGLIGASLILAIHAFTDALLWFPLPLLGLFVLVAGVLGAAASEFMPAIKRLFAGKQLMNHRVAEESRIQFLENNVFETDQRNGILLFVSFFEHRIELLADSGIREAIQQEQWNEVVAHLGTQLRQGNTTEAIVAAINEIADLVESSGLRFDDAGSELDNNLRHD